VVDVTKHDMLAPDFGGVPEQLRRRPQWVVWKLEASKTGKPTKVPYCAKPGKDDLKADSTDPGTWSTFEHAKAAYQSGGYTGVGFVFSPEDDFAGIDLDKCRDPKTGAITTWAMRFLELLESYAEVSPSGTGVKVWVIASHPGWGFKKDRKREGLPSCVEMYDAGRYFTVTGRRIDDAPVIINERKGAYSAIHKEVFGETAKAEKSSVKVTKPANLDDSELIEKAKSAGNGWKFTNLYTGAIPSGSSQSEADLVLCNMLAFWCQGDADRIDRIFRTSALMRDKWDEMRGQLTYGQRTINVAIAGCHSFFEPAGRGRGRPTKNPNATGAMDMAQRVVEAFQEASEDDLDEGEDGSDVDVVESIAQIRLGPDPAILKRQAISAIVRAVLEAEGKLHRDEHGGLWYFHNAKHELMRIEGSKSGAGFASWLARRFGLNRTEPVYSHVFNDVEDDARGLPDVSKLRLWSHYDDILNVLYMDAGGGFMYRLDGTGITRQFNGDYGVLFIAHPNFEPYGDLDLTMKIDEEDGLRRHIFSANFADKDNLKAEQMSLFWSVYCMLLPFEAIFTAKPLIVFEGTMGSGKSFAFKRLGRMILGPNGTVMSLPEKEDDFSVTLKSYRFVWLDNLDVYVKWLENALACVATGTMHNKRELFTTSDMASFIPRCWIGITARDPKFRRPDVADRSLFLRVARIQKKQTEKAMFRAIDERRQSLMVEYLRDLNAIVGYLKEHTEPLEIENRMQDWGVAFLRVMQLMGLEEEGRAALLALQVEQAEFASDGDQLLYALGEWVPESGWSIEVDAQGLCRELNKIVEDSKSDNKFKPHSVGRRLQLSAETLENRFIISSRVAAARKRFYKFAKRNELNHGLKPETISLSLYERGTLSLNGLNLDENNEGEDSER
jgi:putative DNA primase/helicase